MLKAFALWRRVGKNGVEYLSGGWGDLRVVAFENTRKDKDSQPDYQVYFDERKRGNGGAVGGGVETRRRNGGGGVSNGAAGYNDGDDDLPF